MSHGDVEAADDFGGLSEAFLVGDGRNAGRSLSRSVLALCVYNARRRPERVGSGVLLRVDGHHFIVTAGHVVMDTVNQRSSEGRSAISQWH